jgi:hypothetical protein
MESSQFTSDASTGPFNKFQVVFLTRSSLSFHNLWNHLTSGTKEIECATMESSQFTSDASTGPFMTYCMSYILLGVPLYKMHQKTITSSVYFSFKPEIIFLPLMIPSYNFTRYTKKTSASIPFVGSLQDTLKKNSQTSNE